MSTFSAAPPLNTGLGLGWRSSSVRDEPDPLLTCCCAEGEAPCCAESEMDGAGAFDDWSTPTLSLVGVVVVAGLSVAGRVMRAEGTCPAEINYRLYIHCVRIYTDLAIVAVRSAS